MNWLRENWFWVVIGGLFLWMHLRMHGGHGQHGGHGGTGGTGQSKGSTPIDRKEDRNAQH